MRHRHHARSLSILVAASSLGFQCAPPPRFALRATVAHDPDTQPLAHRPARRSDADVPWAVDALVLRPVSHALRFEAAGAAHNVNALDEVPDSSWFTNRAPSPAEAVAGPCREHEPPRAPFTVVSAKVGGYTPGFFVRDANGRRFALKFDHTAWLAPELSTGADAIVSRLYWSIGYNTPCNRVGRITESDLQLDATAYYVNDIGAHSPLSRERFVQTMALVPRALDGSMRVGLSEFLPGEPIGPWPAIGVRDDDPNDRIPHEHRRELRGERLLAAWVNHWDAREPNALDTFVRDGNHGHVAHWMIDFGDTLGGPTGERHRAPRLGYSHVIDVGESLARMSTFGFYHPVWEGLRIDPRTPSLGYFDVDHFTPEAWRPWLPLPRFDNASDQDMAWMARRIAHVSTAHLEAFVAEAHFSEPQVAHRLVEIMLGRRERLLRWSFERVSPLADFTMRDRDTVCATDLAVTSGIGDDRVTRLTADLRTGTHLHAASRAPDFVPGTSRGMFCVRLPHDAPSDAPDDAPARYAVLDLTRAEGTHATRLSAHFYDLGPSRGFVLAGIERW